MAHPPAETVMQEKEAIIVSPSGKNPTLRLSHFLKPTLPSPTDHLPSLPLSSKPIIPNLKSTPLDVKFKGRRYPLKNWKTWVDQLEPLYQDTWKKAGIHEAIISSTYQTLRHNDLVVGLAERWNLETNTFVFPWGEATVTLEDMVVLGGFSVLGESVLSPLKTGELCEMEESLNRAHLELSRAGGGKWPRHYVWMNCFMSKGGLLEHLAFLALWLSRYVFPLKYDHLVRELFPVAVQLAKGIPVALAPAVLSSIYRDLSLLKSSIDKLGFVKCEVSDLKLILWSPLQLVQLWAWERFPKLGPQPRVLISLEPRLARWHRLQKLRINDVREGIDSAGDCFQWRPYVNSEGYWKFNLYRERGEYLLLESGGHMKMELCARILRYSELVGFGCIEKYLPHRVARQFGYDQDVPGYVGRANQSPEIAWSNYTRPVRDVKLYVPARLVVESGVTARYFEWWKQLVQVPHGAGSRGISQICYANMAGASNVKKQKATSTEMQKGKKKRKNAINGVATVGGPRLSSLMYSQEIRNQVMDPIGRPEREVKHANELQEKFLLSMHNGEVDCRRFNMVNFLKPEDSTQMADNRNVGAFESQIQYAQENLPNQALMQSLEVTNRGINATDAASFLAGIPDKSKRSSSNGAHGSSMAIVARIKNLERNLV